MTKEKVNSYMSYFDERIVARGYDYYSRDFAAGRKKEPFRF